jgi:hypothetical protein
MIKKEAAYEEVKDEEQAALSVPRKAVRGKIRSSV